MITSPDAAAAPGGPRQTGQLYTATTQVPPIPPIPAHSTMSMTAFIIAAATLLLFPFVCAMALRLMRRPAPLALAPQWQESPERLDRLEQAVDAIAIEVERISEGQRFLTKLLTDKASAPVDAARALPTGGDTPTPPILGNANERR